MPIIYHITTKPEWLAAKELGSYIAPSLKEEGFIHCSEERQVTGVLDRYFKGKHDLIKLTIYTDKLTSRLSYDYSPSIEDSFPHIYGPINMEAVVEAVSI